MKALLRAMGTRLALAVLGRRLVVRIARAFAMEARLDVTNNMASDGERLVQRIALEYAGATEERVVVIDAGANAGEWTAELVRNVETIRVPSAIEVFAFEPSGDTFKLLQHNLRPTTSPVHVTPVQQALSDVAGAALLNVVHVGAGTNSLHVPAEYHIELTERVQCVTLDGFCGEHGIEHILLLKIDTEGHEMSVLNGAASLLERHAIELIQFEYNHRWIDSRHYLRDAFEFFLPKGYRIGKITPYGIEFYEAWHRELETWNEGNYLACKHEWTPRFRAVKWWNG